MGLICRILSVTRCSKTPSIWLILKVILSEARAGSIYLLALIMLAAGGILRAESSWKDCSIFKDDVYPKAIVFRAPQVGFTDGEIPDYEDWVQLWNYGDGMIVKFLQEEIDSPDFMILENYVRRYAYEYPSKLIMLHFNARARDPYWDLNRYFPGHWLYYPGCTLKHDFDASETRIHIGNDLDLFREDVGMPKTAPDDHRRRVNDDLVLVPVSENGERIWSQAEHMVLQKIDRERGELVVSRGQYGREAQNFSAGRAYIAPHVMGGPWYRNQLWFYNYSRDCPKDSHGQTASDRLVEEFGLWRFPEGRLSHVDGLTLDIARFDMRFSQDGRRIDIDTDGVADGGVVDGINRYGTGFLDFLEKLRTRLGDDFILTADGHGRGNQRALTVLNGMETEGLGAPNDGYRQWSKAWNIITYWQHFGKRQPGFNYSVLKDNSDSEFPLFNRLRFNAGVMTVLGETFDASRQLIHDEALCGIDRERGWLGRSIAGPVNLGMKSVNIFAENGWVDSRGIPEKVFLEKWVVHGGRLDLDSDELSLKSKNRENIELKIPSVSVERGDLIFSFSIKASDPPHGFPPGVPKIINVSVEGMDEIGNGSNSLFTYAGMEEFHSAFFHFRNVRSGLVSISIRIGAPEGRFEFRDFGLRNAVPAVFREFEHGVVLVNPGTEPFVFDLKTLFKERRFRRIQGTPEWVARDPEGQNTGDPVGDLVTVAPINALFLKNTR